MSNFSGLYDYVRPILQGLTSITGKKTFLIFIAAVATMFFFSFVVPIYSLGLSINVFNQGLAPVYSTSFLALGVISVLAIVFILVWLAELIVYINSYTRVMGAVKFSSLAKVSLGEYPRFFFATVFQYLVAIGGLILLVVPGLYFGVSNMFFTVALLSERQTVYSSFKRSNYMARHNYWRSLLTFVVYIALGAVLMYPVLSLGSLALVYRYLMASFFIGYLFTAYTSSSTHLFLEIKSSEKSDMQQRRQSIFGSNLR